MNSISKGHVTTRDRQDMSPQELEFFNMKARNEAGSLVQKHNSYSPDYLLQIARELVEHASEKRNRQNKFSQPSSPAPNSNAGQQYASFDEELRAVAAKWEPKEPDPSKMFDGITETKKGLF